MYSDSELDAAVAAGALSAEAAAALRQFVGQHRAAPDEEQFRLLSGFNDIFVSIALLVFLIALAWLAGKTSVLSGAAVVMVLSWGLAEYFTRKRRLALPSIILFYGFAFSGFFLIAGICAHIIGDPANIFLKNATGALAISAALLALLSYIHWRRFQVPITVASGAALAIGAAIILLFSLFPALRAYTEYLMLAGGLILFAAAMVWDISDKQRATRRTDVAFWLHLAAAPVIVHAIFAIFGILSPADSQVSRAVLVIAVYLAMTIIALAIDRRALLTAALAYVLYAMSAIIRNASTPGLSFALSGFVIGAALLLLSAFWNPARQLTLAILPPNVRAALPAAGKH